MIVALAYGVGTFAGMAEQDPDLERFVANTRPFVARVRTLDWAHLAGRDQEPPARLGSFVTNTVRPIIEEASKLVELLTEKGTWHHAIAASQCMTAAMAMLSPVESHARRRSGAGEVRQNLVQGLTQAVAKATEAVQLGQALMVNEPLVDAREAARQASVEAKAYAEDARVTTEALSELAERARAAAQETEIIRGASDFAKAEERHAQLARRWLAAAGVSGGFLVGAAVLGIMVEGPKLGELSWLAAMSLAYFAPRALLVSAISYALAVCVRNYRSERHNEATNGHRARALRTFETLRLAAKDGRAQDLLLAQAMGAIFSSQPTGYASGGGDGTHVAELVAALAPKKEE